MKILIVNKFLYPNGGSETYIFEIGKQLQKCGHEVQYFGMEHAGRVVGNKAEVYTADMDFHSGKLSKLLYPFKIVYSFDARKKIRKVLEDMQPDVVHLNNINFQITPSVIDEICSYRRATGRNIKIVATAHDYQWVCPNHLMRIPSTGENCDACIASGYGNCIKNRCIHGSKLRSILGTIEAVLYDKRKTYSYIDKVICPSRFLYNKLGHNRNLAGERLVPRHNFFIPGEDYDRVMQLPKEDYVLYFGRYSEEKGIGTLLNAVKQLPEVNFVFAGSGPLEQEVHNIENIDVRGFLSGEELHRVIRQARFSIYPSEWYENCPFSVMESISYGTPVIGADIGGIPELIGEDRTGIEFDSGDADALADVIHKLWNDPDKQKSMEEACRESGFDTVETYVDWMISEIYK